MNLYYKNQNNTKMESISGNVCLICAQTFCTSKRKIVVDEDVLKLLKFLLTNTNCRALRNTQICESCLENIREAYNFKMLYVEKKAFNVVTKIEQTDPEICICQICKKTIKKLSSASFTKELKLVINLAEGIQTGLEATEDSQICISCRESVMNFHSIQKLLSNFNEEHISTLKSEDKSLDIENKIEIIEEPLMKDTNIANENSCIKYKPMQTENTKSGIKTELTHENEVNITYEDFIMKNENVDIKSECEESDVTEPMLKVSEVHNTISHLDVYHKNKKKASIMYDTYCDICGYKTNQEALLTAHMQQHKNIDEIEMFTCNACDYKTKFKSYLRSHMLVHKNVDETEMFTCDVCGFTTKRKRNLKYHMLQHRGVEIEVFSCDVCGFKTKHKASLKGHMLLHRNVDEIKIFSCDACGLKTKHKASLRNHNMLKHGNVDEIKMFSCDVCGFTANRKTNLKRHLLKHRNIGIEMFSCDVCEFKTKHKSSLRTHMLTHRNVDEIEIFTCDVCKFKTKYKSSLKSHMLKHRNVDVIEIFP